MTSIILVDVQWSVSRKVLSSISRDGADKQLSITINKAKFLVLRHAAAAHACSLGIPWDTLGNTSRERNLGALCGHGNACSLMGVALSVRDVTTHGWKGNGLQSAVHGNSFHACFRTSWDASRLAGWTGVGGLALHNHPPPLPQSPPPSIPVHAPGVHCNHQLSSRETGQRDHRGWASNVQCSSADSSKGSMSPVGLP